MQANRAELKVEGSSSGVALLYSARAMDREELFYGTGDGLMEYVRTNTTGSAEGRLTLRMFEEWDCRILYGEAWRAAMEIRNLPEESTDGSCRPAQ